MIDESLYRYLAITYAPQSLAVVSAGVARTALIAAENTGGRARRPDARRVGVPLRGRRRSVGKLAGR
ncbi:hypothetical protein LWP59_16760 [Amycolatopsis acidiphila]|uniref:Uncharacterized protein n=1 Tax=Amycolatopsis acidiphila TaxID=715473 RepID=A0A558AB59_9PSEU|nr:hypothetical protein [Amycolatopsis acidiphila]TVT21477.1 hypothetical protein FNH06_17040 [Amycolatopsis acidiphila]UIJ63158.1 hypothetical protein LWP59_16760 [Amycolatopsis acidiphila]GHG74126.1 hypothetical protein GCM10017788_37740 [Amycolatopsis acidiphila]